MLLLVLELVLFFAATVLLIAGLIVLGREQQANNQRLAELTEQVQSRQTTPGFLGTPLTPATSVERVIEVPVERIVEQRVEVPIVPTSPLDNAPLLSLIEELSRFCDGLNRDSEFFEGDRREISEHVLAKLYEIIERIPGVSVISPAPGDSFDRTHHKVASGTAKPGAKITGLKSPGVQIAERVVKPAVVTL